MEIIKTEIPDVLILKPRVFADDRGMFWESYNKKIFNEIGIKYEFKQDNQSISEKGVLRGLHFQKSPFEQGKLVRVVKGKVLDVAVDIRKDSPYYGQYVSEILSEENKLMLWIPPGFAHGFVSLEDDTVFIYKCTELYNKDSESSILWNDPDLKIDWGIINPIVSEKDKEANLFKDF